MTEARRTGRLRRVDLSGEPRGSSAAASNLSEPPLDDDSAPKPSSPGFDAVFFRFWVVWVELRRSFSRRSCSIASWSIVSNDDGTSSGASDSAPHALSSSEVPIPTVDVTTRMACSFVVLPNRDGIYGESARERERERERRRREGAMESKQKCEREQERVGQCTRERERDRGRGAR